MNVIGGGHVICNKIYRQQVDFDALIGKPIGPVPARATIRAGSQWHFEELAIH